MDAALRGFLLLRQVRLVPVAPTVPAPRTVPAPAHPSAGAPVDVRITDGVITHVAPQLVPHPREEVLDAAGRWAVPGLWDTHVHVTQWAQT
ncbi:amidohydrolase, partial [Georgenia sp. 10Sc9-8]|nr:amidohydrolase [Georgenia halotolerans]